MTKTKTKHSSTGSTTPSTPLYTVLGSTDTSRALQQVLLAQMGTEPFTKTAPERPEAPEGYTETIKGLSGIVGSVARRLHGSTGNLTEDDVTGIFLESLDSLGHTGFDFSGITPALKHRSQHRMYASLEKQYADAVAQHMRGVEAGLGSSAGDVLGVLEARSVVGPDIDEAAAAPNRTLTTVAIEMLLAEKGQQHPKPLALRAGRGCTALAAGGLTASALTREDILAACAGALLEHSIPGSRRSLVRVGKGEGSFSLELRAGVVFETREVTRAGQGLKRYRVVGATTESALLQAQAELAEEHEVNRWSFGSAYQDRISYQAPGYSTDSLQRPTM